MRRIAGFVHSICIVHASVYIYNIAHIFYQVLADEEQASAEATQKLQQDAAAKSEADSGSLTDGGIRIKKEIIDATETATATTAEEVEQPLPMQTDNEKVPAGCEPNNGKEEAEDNKAAVAMPELLFHPIACVQVASRASAEARKGLVLNVTGMYSRALCAERDLAMRRRLCGLAADVCDDRRMAGAENGGGEIAVLARQLFEQALAKVAVY